MSTRRYAIIGTGALGGFYGARLQQVGLEVHFLLHSDYQHVQQHGLLIQSPDGDFHLPQVHAYNDSHKMPLCDVVIVALKTTQNHLLPKLLPPILKDNGVVLVLQNGLGIEADIAQIVGSNRVIGGLCFICSNKVAPGHIRHLDYSEVRLGEYTPNYRVCGVTERLEGIGSDFLRAGIPTYLAENLLLARWQKLVWNIPYNGLSVVLDAQTDRLMVGEIRGLVEQLMQEVVAGAKSCNCALSDDIIDKMLDHTQKMKPYRTSMKIDYDERRPLEVEAIFGNPLRMANVALPRIEMLYQQLKFLNNKNLGIV